MARSLPVVRWLTCALAIGVAGYAPRAAADTAPTAPQTSPTTPQASPAEPQATVETVTAPVSPATSPAPGPAAVAPAPTTDVPQDAEALYHLAFAALADADTALARSLLDQLRAKHPSHPLAERATELLALMAEPHGTTAVGATPAVSEPERSEPRRGASTTGIARAELVFAQTVHGIALGAELCLMAECDGAQSWSALLMLGAGAGFTTSFFASDGGVSPGLSRALTDGVMWGAANGFMLMLGTGALDGIIEEGPVIGAHLAVGQLLGLGLAGGLYWQLEPSAGQVSLTSSGGLWTLAATAQLVAALEPDLDDQEWAWLLLGASDLGLLAGGLLAAQVPMSTSRVLMIDAAGLLGSLTGIGIAVLAQADPELGPTFGAGFAGTVLGLGLAYHFTRDWDDDGGDGEDQPRLTLMPLADGLALGVRGQL